MFFFESGFSPDFVTVFLSLAFAAFTASTLTLFNLVILAIFSFFISSASAMNFIDFSPVKWYSSAVALALLVFCCTSFEKFFFGEALQLSSPATPSLEGCRSRGLHAGYSLDFADEGKGPQMPALSSAALPNLLDAIDHFWLRAPPLCKEAEAPKEHNDLLDSLAMKDAPEPSSTKDICQKFLNILEKYQRFETHSEAGKSDSWSQLGKSASSPGCGEPPPAPEVSMNSDWGPGKIPMTDEDPKRVFKYKNPLYKNPFGVHPKVSIPVPTIIHNNPKVSNDRPVGGDQGGSEEVLPSLPVEGNFLLMYRSPLHLQDSLGVDIYGELPRYLSYYMVWTQTPVILLYKKFIHLLTWRHTTSTKYMKVQLSTVKCP